MKNFQLKTQKIKKLHSKLKKQQIFLLYASLLLYCILLFGILFTDINIRRYIENNSLLPFPIQASLTSYPTTNVFNKPDISARAAVVMDDDSKVVLFSKNPTLLFSMASTTKIMTALVALSYYKMDDVLTIQTENVDGVTIGFRKGQKISFQNLLYAMLLASGNDAALAIAENYPGGEQAFINKMNSTAYLLHLYNTHFGDAVGLLDKEDYTTAIELARLAAFALKNKILAEVVATKHKVIFTAGDPIAYSIYNLNKLLGVDGINGVKTGYTDEAGQVLVASKDEKGHTIIAVVMDSRDRFLDTQKLLSVISDNVTYLSIHP